MAAKKSRKRRKPGKLGGSVKDQSTAITAQPTTEDDQPQFTTTHSPILEMPLDIMNLIMDNISELHHLLDISLVSRALNALASPFLYHAIVLHPNSGPLPRIPQLLRSLMSRPDLCGHVKTVIIGPSDQPWAEPYPAEYSPYFPFPLGRINIPHAVDLISQTGMSHQDCWVEHFKKGDTEAALALLLTLLPNLKSLTIQPGYNESVPFLLLAIRGAFGPGKAHDKARAIFRNLEVVSLDKECRVTRGSWSNAAALSVYGACSSESAPTDWNNFVALSLFYFPNLKEISVSINSTRQHDGRKFWPYGTPDLGGLEVLKINRIRENSIGTILATCSKLKKLTWSIRYDPTDAEKIYSNGPIDRDQVVAALAVASTTLTDLTFETDDHEVWRPYGISPGPKVGPSGSFKPLRKFGSIKTLTLPWFLLVDHDESPSWGLADVLPRNLEHLFITDRRSSDAPRPGGVRAAFAVYAAIRDWLHNWRYVTPRLKSLSIDVYQISNGRWTKKDRQEMRKLCRGVGLEHHEDERDISKCARREDYHLAGNCKQTHDSAGSPNARLA